MFRLIIWFIIFYLVYLFFKKAKRGKKAKKKRVKIVFPKKEKMLKCENCQIYAPESSGIYYKDKFFCSEKCQKEYHEKA